MRNDRQEKIIHLLFQNENISCEELANKLEVSIATVRRDLTQLEKEGQVRRTHGGAVLIRTRDQDNMEVNIVPPWSSRQEDNHQCKVAIAKKVAPMIPNNAIVFVDSGTSAYEVARQLIRHVNITVITNSIKVSSILGMYPNISLFFIGGKIAHTMLSSSGMIALNCLSFFKGIDYCIMSCDGFTMEDGMQELYMDTAFLKKTIVEKSKTVIAVMDHSKFGKSAIASYCKPSDIDILVTDSEIDENMLTELEESNIRVDIAEV